MLRGLKWSESTGDATDGPPGGGNLWIVNQQMKQFFFLSVIVIAKHWTLVGHVGSRLHPPSPAPYDITGCPFVRGGVGGEDKVKERERGGRMFRWAVVELNSC